MVGNESICGDGSTTMNILKTTKSLYFKWVNYKFNNIKVLFKITNFLDIIHILIFSLRKSCSL